MLWRLDATHFPNAIDRAGDLDPGLPAIQYEAGNASLNRRDSVHAREDFERALRSSPQHFYVNAGTGVRSRSTGA